jgi:hypothetical protein
MVIHHSLFMNQENWCKSIHESSKDYETDYEFKKFHSVQSLLGLLLSNEKFHFKYLCIHTYANDLIPAIPPLPNLMRHDTDHKQDQQIR